VPAVTLKGHLSKGHEGFPPRPSVEGCAKVTVGSVPVHCEGQAWAPHSSGGHTHDGYLASGAPHVTIAGRSVGRIGDPISCGDTVAQGCPRVTIGDCGGPGFGREMIFKSMTDPKDKLIICLPEMANAEAERESGPDRQGWLYLHDMFEKWFSGPANTDAKNNPEPFQVDWDWVMQFLRARNAYNMFTSVGAGTEPNNIYNKASRAQIGSYLQRDGKLTDRREEFDYTALPWPEWYGRAFNYRSVPQGITPDGLHAALAGFTFYTLAKGNVEPNSHGGHTITISKCSVFIYDQFDFKLTDDFLYWSCEQKDFSILPGVLPGNTYQNVTGSDFYTFRTRTGFGNDFRVFSQQHMVEGFQGMRYEYP